MNMVTEHVDMAVVVRQQSTCPMTWTFIWWQLLGAYTLISNFTTYYLELNFHDRPVNTTYKGRFENPYPKEDLYALQI